MFHFTYIATMMVSLGPVMVSIGSGSAVEPVKLRWASDHGGPPHLA